MTLPTRSTEPTRIISATKVEWYKTLDDYPASLWTLIYKFRHTTGVGLNVTCTADGDNHVATITTSASVTGFNVAGRYKWQSVAVRNNDSANVRQVSSGYAFVELQFGTNPAATEIRSVARQTLDAINAALLGSATTDILEYEVSTPAGTTKVKRMTRKELLDLKAYFARIVKREMQNEAVRETGNYPTGTVARLYDDA